MPHNRLHQSEHLSGGVDAISGLDATQIGSGVVTNTEYEMLDGVDTSSVLATQDYVKTYVSGLDPQESVLDKDVSDPSTLTPSSGDRYIVGAGAVGDWSGHDGEIAEYDGSAWVFTSPTEGFYTWVEDENLSYIYDGTAWVKHGTTINHGDLNGLGLDHHTQYLLVDGTRAMSGSLNMSNNDIDGISSMDASGTIDFTSGVHIIKILSATAQPTLTSGEVAIWRDTTNNRTYLLYNRAGTHESVELT